MNSTYYQTRTILFFLKYFKINFIKNGDVISGKSQCSQKEETITKSFFIKFNEDKIYAIKKEDDYIAATLDLVSTDLDEVLEFLFPDLVRVLKIDYLLL